ncbi:hypothetical protein GLOIN_2v1706438 [Rhizophagus clarus]|uniref:Uncharacterized protein n=1 Tax=Rhizophagus clarus TaxID=94130 RepID=A0A8H3KSD4_9GLOM|nr:hypothetical protein GLOIN_2v1706438 [Rhizophagus clarus]
MKSFLWLLVISCIVCNMLVHALPAHEDQSLGLMKRCSFFSTLIGDCDDGKDVGENCSVLPCKQNLSCKVDQTGTPTCTVG